MARESVVPDGSRALLPGADVDAPYVNRVLCGDTDAFAPLWEKYERSLHRFFASRVGATHEAEDLTSETLVAALESLPRFRAASGCTFHTYLHAIARHKLSHWLRRKKTHRETELDGFNPNRDSPLPDWRETIADGAGTPLDTLLQSEGTSQVCQALAAVPSPNQFKALLLHYMAGLDHKEVGVLLTARSETINSRLQDGRKSFRQQYQALLEAV